MQTDPKSIFAPDYVLANNNLKTQRQWKAMKRRQLRALKKAMDAYRMGCVFTPATYGEVGAISSAIESLTKALSVRNWGR